MSRKTIDILGVNVDSIEFEKAVDVAESLMKSEEISMIFTPNPEIIMCARDDSELRSILNSADLCTADGIGVVYASRIIGKPVPERVAGFDVVCALLERAAKSGTGVFLFGAKPGVAEIAKKNLEEKHPGIKIVGTHDGYFKEDEEAGIVAQINESGAELLLVCLGAPKQEKWIAKHKDELKVNLCMGVGGTLDVLAGTAKRAPKLFIKLNLEWFYRLLKQPTRIGRMMVLPRFILVVKKDQKEKAKTERKKK